MALPTALLGLGSAISGLVAGRKRKKAARETLKEQQGLADRQLGYADQMGNFINDLMKRNPNVQDAYGGGAFYDPVTGQWQSRLSDRDRAIQDASDAEELERLTGDQALARRGMYGAESIRQGAQGGSEAFLSDLLGMREGRGTVNADDIINSLIARRTDAVNAGFDEVQRGLRSQSMRTGASDTAQLRRLAQLRSQEIARTMGVPEVEGIQIADQLNQNRNQTALGNYGVFAGIGSNYIDRGFNPSDRFLNNLNLQFKAREMDQGRLESAAQGAIGGAAITNNAAANLLRARGYANEQVGQNNVGNFLGSLSSLFGGRSGGKANDIVVSRG